MTEQAQEAARTTSHAPATTTVTVIGMTCGHCTAAVHAALGRLTGVTQVDVHLANRAVTIRSTMALDLSTIRGAIADAGYEMER